MFFLTTLSASPRNHVVPRCVGFFKKLEDARKVLEKNLGELDEAGHYNLAVIEEIGEGLYQMASRQRYWYGFLQSKNGWEVCQEPECYQRIRNFAL